MGIGFLWGARRMSSHGHHAKSKWAFVHKSGVLLAACILKWPTNRLFVQHLVQDNNHKENIKAQHYGPFVKGIHQPPLVSHHKGSVMRTEFPCHDVIMVVCLYRWLSAKLWYLRWASHVLARSCKTKCQFSIKITLCICMWRKQVTSVCYLRLRSFASWFSICTACTRVI